MKKEGRCLEKKIGNFMDYDTPITEDDILTANRVAQDLGIKSNEPFEDEELNVL